MPFPSGGTLPAPGEPLGPYVVERVLGRGGMGAVFVARDAQGRRVALKRARTMSRDPEGPPT
jgi:hypothetical protein